MFVYWMPYKAQDKLPGHCTVLRTSKWSEEMPIAGRFVKQGLLAAKLKLTLKNFDRDCFYWDGFTFVSKKMRDAMALGPSDIQYFDVDTSESAPVPRSKSYKTMHVPVTEDVADLQNSDYLIEHHSDGSQGVGTLFSLVFRMDARPAHEIFHERSFKYIYCTDEIALRVLQAGCSGAFFVDPCRWSGGGNLRFRSLRGLEEIVEWDSKVMRTELVREIP
jgi:hypothetical protein